MKIKEIFVTSAEDATMVKAQLLLCEKCESDQFRIIVIEGHTHMECYQCHTTFCDGKCGEIQAGPKSRN